MIQHWYQLWTFLLLVGALVSNDANNEIIREKGPRWARMLTACLTVVFLSWAVVRLQP